MNICFVITSSIETSNVPLTYSGTRTFFSSEERLRQTVYTIDSIQTQCPDATIYLLDSSTNYSHFVETFGFFQNVRHVPLAGISKDLQNVVSTHKHKTYCECLMLSAFFENYKKEIKAFDFIMKSTGRYVSNYKNATLDTDKIYFKKPNTFKWHPDWNTHFPLIDRRSEEGHDVLKQYCTVTYGFGNKHIQKFTDAYIAISQIVNQEKYSQYDFEGLMYFLMQNYKEDIVETDWLVTGFDGTSGRLMKY